MPEDKLTKGTDEPLQQNVYTNICKIYTNECCVNTNNQTVNNKLLHSLCASLSSYLSMYLICVKKTLQTLLEKTSSYFLFFSMILILIIVKNSALLNVIILVKDP